MCCRLRLDKSELRKRGGGLFGSNPLTGSIGVVTVNLPRLGYLSASDAEFAERLDRLVDLGLESLRIKRRVVEQQTEAGLYPYCRHALRNVKQRTGGWWGNHFGTIGVVGMHEALANLWGEDEGVHTPRGRAFAEELMHRMRDKLSDAQEADGWVYNLEATPAEGASHRLARLDRDRYPDILSAGEGDAVYYTNSTQLPVDYSEDVFDVLDKQDELQSLYTGGTVQHLYLGQRLDDPAAGAPVDPVGVRALPPAVSLAHAHVQHLADAWLPAR